MPFAALAPLLKVCLAGDGGQLWPAVAEALAGALLGFCIPLAAAMATGGKMCIRDRETPVPENTAPADGTISSVGPPADAAAPPDSDDLSALLASMDQTNDSASTDQPDGDATLEGSNPPLEFMETEASDEAAPEDDGTASGAPSDSDEPAGSAAGEDGDGEEETPSNLSAEGADVYKRQV